MRTARSAPTGCGTSSCRAATTRSCRTPGTSWASRAAAARTSSSSAPSCPITGSSIRVTSSPGPPRSRRGAVVSRCTGCRSTPCSAAPSPPAPSPPQRALSPRGWPTPRPRVSTRGLVAATDPRQLNALGAAAADLEASRLQFLTDIDRLYDAAASGAPIGIELRAEIRRNQVRASGRVGEAVDRLVAIAGGSAMRLDNPIQRFWRDLHIALGHGANVAEQIYQATGTVAFGGQLPANVRM
ncbi:hypothetical protein [Nocardioides nematodiphilus]|uniref:hypothetical protein n=1 Tax=Nocardioides nematodiphilus TaxID=2849669 RepID=UPI001CDA32A7|nr:hypothetical protein [Nocardioides nematodiphilus]